MLVVLLSSFAAQVMFSLAAVPPWQNPDEPQHLMAARLIVAHGAAFTVGARDEVGERDIVASMARHGWWSHYGRPTPVPLPSTFVDGPAAVVQDAFVAPGGSRLYYRSVAAVFRFWGIESVVAQMYTMRLLSMVASLLTVLCVWAGARVWLDRLSSFVISALVTMHPQFVIVSTTASPDAAANLAAAIVWWKAVTLLVRPPSFEPLAVMWAAAIAGFLTRRMAAPLLIGALLVTFVVWVRAIRSGAFAPGVRRFTYVFALLVIIVVVAWRSAPEDLDVRTMQWRWATAADALSAIQSIRFSPGAAARALGDRMHVLPAFLLGMFETFWLAIGWLRYKAPPQWYGVVAALGVASAAGIAFRRNRRYSTPVLVAAVTAVALQLTAVVVYYLGIMGAGPQGRYLFPVLSCVMSLMWIGWQGLFSVNHRQRAAVILLSTMALLNAYGWTAVLLPAYL
jgi:hypothetical protein